MRLPTLALLLAVLTLSPFARAADHLVLNPRLDYSSDSNDGPLLTGSDMDSTLAAGVPNYLIIYGEACYNSKRQARRTVELAQRFGPRVHFVVVDLDQRHTPAQEALLTRFFRGSIPHVVITDAQGKPLYNQAGEVENATTAMLLQQALEPSR